MPPAPYKASRREGARAANRSNAATPKPTNGESSKDSPMFSACPQSTTGCSGPSCHHLVGNPHSNNGSDEGVRTGCREAEVPGARFQRIAETNNANTIENPALLRPADQFDGQERDDAEGDQSRRRHHSEEIPEAGPDHRDVSSSECV